MRSRIAFLIIFGLASSAAMAGSQSSNSSSNSSSNNGVVRERVVDTYCEDGYCDQYVHRRVYRDDRRRFRAAKGWHRDAYGNWYRVRRDD